jgi:hypothetical protein
MVIFPGLGEAPRDRRRFRSFSVAGREGAGNFRLFHLGFHVTFLSRPSSCLGGSATNVRGRPRSEAAQDVAVPLVGPRHAADAEGHLAGLHIGEPVLSEQRREVLW